MAEIKSTLELAMERTKKMTISEKEKEEIKRKEIWEKAIALFHRYREGHVPLNEIQKEMEKLDEKTYQTVKEILFSQWVEALSLKEGDERLIKGIELLKNRGCDEVMQKFRHLLSQYQKEMEKARREVRTQLKEALRREGIDGNAVEPNVDGSLTWKEASDKLDHLYGVKLEEVKKALRGL